MSDLLGFLGPSMSPVPDVLTSASLPAAGAEQEWGWSSGCVRWHLGLGGAGGMTEGLNEGLKETSCKLWSKEAAV